MANVVAEICSWYCVYIPCTTFINTVVFWLINIFYDFVLNKHNVLDDPKERRGYSHLKEKALDRTMWRARFGRGFGPVLRQTTKWMNETHLGWLPQSASLCILYAAHDSDFFTIKKLEFLMDAQYVSCNVSIEDSMPFTLISGVCSSSNFNIYILPQCRLPNHNINFVILLLYNPT
jgi:hypothetical protein